MYSIHDKQSKSLWLSKELFLETVHSNRFTPSSSRRQDFFIQYTNTYSNNFSQLWVNTLPAIPYKWAITQCTWVLKKKKINK